ncbi:MAG: hypothetical protein MUP55_00790 [Candidatus Aenigmarchaeota archaeon]|nr:hypothetical protein [Candidatus Aenigmarchaeota archaeon]
MDILKRIFDTKYNTVYNYLESAGFKKMEDATIATNGKKKIILGEDSLIFIYGNRAEEMSYDSFIELTEKYNKISKLLEQKEFIKTRKPFGVDVYQEKNNAINRILVGRDFRVIFGKVRDKKSKTTFTYDGGLQFLEYY